MKIALVHDYLKEYGGAERVLEALHEIYPSADIYTSVYLPSYLGPHRKRFKDWQVQTSWLQFIPGKAKLMSPFRLLSPFAFRSFDFSKYDVILTSATGAYFPNSLRKGKAKLICYCHTPPRYLYGYATAREWKNNFVLRLIGQTLNHFLRILDYQVSHNVDQYLANSEEVKARIAKFYRRDALVVYPPVDLIGDRQVGNGGLKEGYFLTGGRLARAKHVDLIIKACILMNAPLKVFGKGFVSRSATWLQGPRVEYLGEITDEKKLELMADAKAFLFASEDEDFGITPVEAMGQGTPVIAYKSGGVQETVVEGKTGIFFGELSAESLAQALKKFDKLQFNKQEIRKHALKFSKEVFQKRVKAIIDNYAGVARG